MKHFLKVDKDENLFNEHLLQLKPKTVANYTNCDTDFVSHQVK